MNNLLTTTAYKLSDKLKKETIPKTFVKRNNFAPMSIRYNRAIGYNMNNMFSMVGQLRNAGQNNAKTILEENELGKPVQSKTKHTVLGLKTIRTGNSFSKTIKKENRLTTLKPIPAKHILRNFSFNSNDNDETQEFRRIAGLIANNRIRTLSKPIIIHTKNNKLGIYKIEKNNADSANKIKSAKLYSLEGKTTNIKKRTWLKDAYEKQLSNLDRIYMKVAKNILDRNARAFHISLRQ
jgi:hypothetical protein